MHNFWYHSPVRFYRTKEELQDKRNPQNNQFYGENKPYPLEIGVDHWFLFPQYNPYEPDTVGDVAPSLKLFLVNDTEKIELYSVFKVNTGGKLIQVRFTHHNTGEGWLEVYDVSTDKVVFYSNCISFINSSLPDGRKFIRVKTKHNYNRQLFDYENNDNSWFITNLPAYDLGQFYIDAEINNTRTGGNNTLQIAETYLDEIVSYQFVCNGDANVLSFIQMATTNSEFYIDGTKRTLVEKIDADEFAMTGTMKFANVKDEYGLNITLNYT